MFQKWTKSLFALALALLLSPVLTAGAHDRNTRHRHREDGRIIWLGGHNTNTNNNGVRRRARVRRGRNMTPGVPRGRVVVGRIDRDDIPRVVKVTRGRGHGRGHGKH